MISVLLVGGGVIQNLSGSKTVTLLEPIAVSAETVTVKQTDGTEIIINEGDILDSYKRGDTELNSETLLGASISAGENTHSAVVTCAGQTVKAKLVTEQYVPMGPAASQVAIKQTGTNGGGYMGVNSAHPLENPNAFTNIIEMTSILLIPAALCFTFGRAVKNKKQGIAIFMAMFICLVLALGIIAVNEQSATPQFVQNGAVDISALDQAGGNMEGKETRF